MKIFLSYGHDNNSALVERIRKDLEARGHDIWIDMYKIKNGDDWRRAITDGIIDSNWVLSFLSQHSTRNPGVCLDELAIALGVKGGIVQTVLVESEQDVTPPISVSHIQWLDMHEWQEHWDATGNFPLQDGWYDKKFAEIVRVTESEMNLRFAGEIEALKGKLKPLTSDARIGWLLSQEFVGRQWLANDIDNWLSEGSKSRVFVLTGEPGVGKSAFSAWLAHHNKANIIAAHFIEYNKPDRQDPRRVITSIAFQIASRVPDYRKLLMGLPELDELAQKNGTELFAYLLTEPLHQVINGGRQRYLVLIDALDEASQARGNSLVDLIAQEAEKLPEWITLLVTTRSDPAIIRKLSHLAPHEFAADDARNREDLSSFILQWLERRNYTGNKEKIVRSIVEASEGNFLYLKQFCQGAETGGWIHIEDAVGYPKGMTGMYQSYFKRQFPDISEYERHQVPLLELIVASYEPLEESLLEQILGLKGRERIKVLEPLGSLCQRQKGLIAPYHKSMKDWLIKYDDSGEYYTPVENGHRKLADHGWRQFKTDKEQMADYHLKWLPAHLTELKEWDKLTEILKNFVFLMGRVKAGHLERMLADYRELASASADVQNNLRLWQAFFREKAHILRRGNEEWPSYRILFQLAIEHADASPITKQAEEYLAMGKVDWVWLFRNKRLNEPQVNSCLAVLEGHSDCVRGVIQLSNTHILSWSRDNTLRLWDQKNTLGTTLEGHSDEVNGAIELSDGTLLSWSKDKSLRIWDQNGKLIKILDGHSNWINGAIELRDASILSWSADATLCLWDKGGHNIKTLKGHHSWVNGAMELSDGRWLSWSKDNTLLLWQNDGQNNTLNGHSYDVVGASELHDGRILSWSDDGTLNLWDKDGGFINTMGKYCDSVRGAIELKNGGILSWAWNEKNMQLWDKDGNPINILEGHTGLLRGALELQNGRILSWTGDGYIQIWDEDGSYLRAFKGHLYQIFGIIELRDGTILSWAEDNVLRLWDTNGTNLNSFQGHSQEIIGASELNDGTLISWSVDKTIRLWDRHGSIINTLDGHSYTVIGAIELRNKRLLTWDYLVLRLWDQSGKLIKILDGHNNWINGATELSDKRLLSWAKDGTLRLWGQDGDPIVTLMGHNSSVQNAIELKDGRILSADHKSMHLWDKDGTFLSKSTGYYIWGMIELGNHKICSWYNKRLQLWDENFQIIKTCEGHQLEIIGAAELNDKTVLSWSSDEVILWDNKGILITVISRENYPELYPEWTFLIENVKQKTHYAQFRVDSYQPNSIGIFPVNIVKGPIALWHGEVNAIPWFLYPDGLAIATQDNGQVCFLKLYNGAERIGLDELISLEKKQCEPQKVFQKSQRDIP
ncbi:MAG: TIR domain-containing protein [Syntrophaceae bacterium]|nr:TIR domain-containing protein [Syntrophaceae bacterium]